MCTSLLSDHESRVSACISHVRVPRITAAGSDRFLTPAHARLHVSLRVIAQHQGRTSFREVGPCRIRGSRHGTARVARSQCACARVAAARAFIGSRDLPARPGTLRVCVWLWGVINHSILYVSGLSLKQLSRFSNSIQAAHRHIPLIHHRRREQSARGAALPAQGSPASATRHSTLCALVCDD